MRWWNRTRPVTTPRPDLSDAQVGTVRGAMMSDLLTVNEARRRVGSAPLPDGDVLWSEWMKTPFLMSTEDFKS